MDISKFKEYYRKTEAQKIHEEIFKESSDYKSYILGLAQGIYIVYDFLKKYKDKINDNILIEALENIVSQEGSDEKLQEYFKRMIKNEDEKLD